MDHHDLDALSTFPTFDAFRDRWAKLVAAAEEEIDRCANAANVQQYEIGKLYQAMLEVQERPQQRNLVALIADSPEITKYREKAAVSAVMAHAAFVDELRKRELTADNSPSLGVTRPFHALARKHGYDVAVEIWERLVSEHPVPDRTQAAFAVRRWRYLHGHTPTPPKAPSPRARVEDALKTLPKRDLDLAIGNWILNADRHQLRRVQAFAQTLAIRYPGGPAAFRRDVLDPLTTTNSKEGN